MKLKQTNNTTYAEQRKSRLQDVVDDYLQDDDVSVLEMYNDIRDCLEDIISYHEMCKSRAQGALELIVGHHSTDKVDTRARARAVAMKIENTAASQSWKLGTFRLDIQPDGRR